MKVAGAGAHRSDEELAQNPAMSESSYEGNLNTAKKMAADDPKRVAQVINNWVTTDG